MRNSYFFLRSRKLVLAPLVLVASFLLTGLSLAEADDKALDQVMIDLVKVDKSERKMYLLKGDTVVKEFRVAVGSIPYEPKRAQGDERTPEGLYTLDYIKEDSNFYRAMHIDYPNEEDRQQAKQSGIAPGGHIMVHGQPNNLDESPEFTQLFNWTNGCIALTNTEMDEFMDLVKVGTKIQIFW